MIATVLLASIFIGPELVTEYLPRLIFKRNFAEIIPGEFYRSGQMSHQRLARTITSNKIRTVLDLRYGEDDPEADGKREKDIVAELGGKYLHFPLRASRRPEQKTIQELIQILDTLESPVLVHCSDGAHRTSVVSAIWMLTQAHEDLSLALEQMSPRYGFVKAERQFAEFLNGYPTIDDLIWDYQQETNGQMPFREWVAK